MLLLDVLKNLQLLRILYVSKMWESTKCKNNENSGREVAPYELYWCVKSGSHFYARMTTNVRLLALVLILLKDI